MAPWVGSCVEAALYRRGYETEPSLEEGERFVSHGDTAAQKLLEETLRKSLAI